MALNGDLLGQTIANALIDSNCPSELRTQIEDKWKEIAGIIVDHIKTYGQVNVVSVSGVTTGTGVSGPGTGTIV